jgi:anti-sigma factor RsiW
MKTTIPITDEELVAYLDDALGASRRGEIDAALALDERLGARLAALDIDKPAIAAAFAATAAAAPVERLRSRIDAEVARARSRPRAGAPWARIAAALVLGVGLGYAAAFRVSDDPDRNWHVAVADYQALYTTATLASIAGDPATQRSEVAAVAAKLGLSITADALQIPGLAFKRAQLLEFNKQPLAQFAYLDPVGVPVALCATRTGDADGPIQTGTFRGLAAAFWSKNGYGFILIGATQADALQRAAAALARQIEPTSNG